MTSVELLTFSMRSQSDPPKGDWFRIVEAKKAGDPTKVYIYDEIGFWGTNAKDFAAQLDEIDNSEIHLHINSPGGSVFDGLAIFNSLKNHKAKVTGIVDGMAASAASFILQAADTRQMSRNAQVMIHDAKAFAGGNADQMRKAADLLDRISNEIADIYAVRSDQTKSADEFRAIMRAGDQWYNGNEAMDAGLVDEVTDNPDPAEDAPSTNSWSAEEVEAFIKTPSEKLAANANQLTIKNRVEEAQMGDDNTPQKQTPPPTQQPPAPVAQTQPPAAPVAPVTQPTTSQAAVSVMVNGVEVTDLTAIQSHITALETFRKDTIEDNRKNFVKQLAADGKILANDDTLSKTEEFALSLSPEQFSSWKATMEAAPVQKQFQQHGVTPGNQSAPQNGNSDDAVQNRITVLKEIVDSHRASGMSEESLQTKDSYKELQKLMSQQTGA